MTARVTLHVLRVLAIDPHANERDFQSLVLEVGMSDEQVVLALDQLRARMGPEAWANWLRAEQGKDRAW